MKKYAIVFLSLLLVVSLPFAAHANIVTATGKYIINAVKHAPGGAKVHATDTVTGAKHVIKHGVSSADLGKSIGAGIVGFGVGTGAGLAFKALTGLALDGVDWVMDPANNQINWKEKSGGAGGSSSGAITPSDPYQWGYDGIYYKTADYACRAAFKGAPPGWVYVNASIHGDSADCNVIDPDGTAMYNTVYRLPNPAYDPSGSGGSGGSGDDVYKSLPLVDLSKKVLDLADSGNAAAQKDVETHVAHKAQNGDLDNELDNAPDITQPENPEEPNPEEPQECPSGTVKVDDVCVKIPDSDGDEPLFCDSYKFTKKVCDWIDWTQEEHDEPEPDSGKVDIIDKSEDLSIDNDRIDFSNQCPAPTPINTSVGGFPVSTELNYQPLCDFFTMLNPFVIGMGGISSALIIAGGARRG